MLHFVIKNHYRMETLDLKGAAAVLHCHPETLKGWARSNAIPATKVGRNWAAKYEMECQRLESLNLENDGAVENSRIVRNGWV